MFGEPTFSARCELCPLWVRMNTYFFPSLGKKKKKEQLLLTQIFRIIDINVTSEAEVLPERDIVTKRTEVFGFCFAQERHCYKKN